MHRTQFLNYFILLILNKKKKSNSVQLKLKLVNLQVRGLNVSCASHFVLYFDLTLNI